MTYAEEKARHWGAPVPPHLKHGRNTYAFKVYGCDCLVCLPAGKRRVMTPGGTPAKERNRKLRENKWGKPVPPGVKHGIYAYKVYGCRCDICKTAANSQREEYRNTWRTRATGSWSKQGKADVLHWPPVGRGIWTCPDCGQQFRHRAPKEATLAA